MIERAKGKDAVLCILNDKIDKDFLEKNRQLKIIANYGVGYDNIDVENARRLEIFITNTPSVLTDSTADLTWGLLLAASRRIVESDHFLRAGKYKGWDPLLLLGFDVSNKTLGIIGAGRIGTAVAHRSAGFNMKILYTHPRQHRELEENHNAEKAELDELLKKSDFVSIHVPLTPQTKHLINYDKLKLMKKTAVLINTSRGAVINEEDLLTALENKIIAAAGLDVFEFEPKVTEGLLKKRNVVLLPHIGSATFHTRNKMSLIAAQNILVALSGSKPPNVVNNL